MKNIINKGYAKDATTEIKDAVQRMKKYGIIPRVNVLLKPPFFSEQEGIDCCIETVTEAKKIGIEEKQIHIESLNVQDGTLVHLLYDKGLYSPPSMWSIIKVIIRLSEFGISPCKYIVSSLEGIRCCGDCGEKVWDAIMAYNSNSSDIDKIKEFQEHNCGCYSKWVNEVNPKDSEKKLGHISNNPYW